MGITSTRIHLSDVMNWSLWFFVASSALAMMLSLAAGKVLVQRRRKRQNLLMRDHLNRNFPDLRAE